MVCPWSMLGVCLFIYMSLSVQLQLQFRWQVLYYSNVTHEHLQTFSGTIRINRFILLVVLYTYTPTTTLIECNTAYY